MRHARFVFAIAFFTSSAGVLIEGCGSGTPSCPAGDVCTSANGDDGGRDIGNPSDGGGGGGDGSSSTTCADAGPVDDNPACNSCAYANCCTQITACQADPNCTGLEACLAACASNDTECQLTCQVEYDPTTLQNVGVCAQQRCPTECKAPDSGGPGFDF